MTALDKLRAIDAAASPGDWEHIGINDEEHAKALEANDAFTTWVYASDGDEVATFDARELRQNDANSQLAALSKLLLPFAEALEKAHREANLGQHNCDDGYYTGCAARKALEEALKDTVAESEA